MYGGWEDFSFPRLKAKADKLNPLIGPCEWQGPSDPPEGRHLLVRRPNQRARASASGLRDYLTDSATTP